MHFSVTNRSLTPRTTIVQTLSLGSRGVILGHVRGVILGHVILGHVLSTIVVSPLLSFPAAVASTSRLAIRGCRFRSRDTLPLLLRRHLSHNTAPQLFSVPAHLLIRTLCFIALLILVAPGIPRCPRACPLLRHLRAWRIQ